MSDIPYKPERLSTKKNLEQKDANQQQINERNQEDEVDIWDLVKIIWDGRFTIAIFIIVFTAFGYFHTSYGPDGQFTSDAILLQESPGGGSQSTSRLFQQFGGVFGFSPSGGEGGVITPSLYPTIIESASFRYELIFEEYEFTSLDTTMTLYTYFNEFTETPLRSEFYEFALDYTVYLPINLYDFITNISFFEEEKTKEEEDEVEINERILRLTSDERSAMDQLTSRILLSMEGGIVTVETSLPDPKAAVLLNIEVIDKIQEYVTEYKIEKARQNLEFVEQQYEAAKKRYEQAQNALAEFRDQNINISSNVFRTEEERLQNQSNMTFDIYNSISAQLEQARLRLQEETPVFSVLQKSSYPTSQTGSSTTELAIFVILGGFFGLAYIFGVQIFQKLVMEVKAR